MSEEPVVTAPPVLEDFTLTDLRVLHAALSKVDCKGSDWKVVGTVMVKLEQKLNAAMAKEQIEKATA